MSLIGQIEEKLLRAIPRAVRKSQLNEPIYAIVVQYYGLDSYGDLTPVLRMPTCSRRNAVLQANGETAPHHIWSHCEFDDEYNVVDSDLKDSELVSLCSNWYDDLRNEKVELSDFRICVQRVCKRLNKANWQSKFNVSDDFVLYPGDMTDEFNDTYGDMVASIPKSRLIQLQELGYLGRETWWKHD